MKSQTCFFLAALLMVLTWGCKAKPPAQEGKQATSGAPGAAPGAASTTADTPEEQPAYNPTLKLVKDLAMLAHGIPIDKTKGESKAQDIDDGDLTIHEYIDDLLDSNRVGKHIAKGIILGGGQNTKTRHPVPSHSTLKSKKIDGYRVYYLRKPCAKSEAVSVDPWWEPGDEILVCPDSYRADIHKDKKGRTCGSLMLSPSASNICGCGPRMIYCTRDSRHYSKVQSSAQREVVDTVAHVVNKNRPIEDLFLMNETVRNRDAEYIYRRARIAAGEPAEVANMDEFSNKSRLKKRHEQIGEHHAGILTAPSLIYGSDALRGVLRNFYDYLWCSGQASSGVTTQAVLGLDVVDLREGDGWRALAAMDICTDCHARLDYGMQFFHGYPSSSQGVDFRPGESLKGKGELYGDGIKDLRGKDALTPKGFARLALAQDDFATCMTKKINDHVFSGDSTTEDFAAIADTFKKTHRFKDMLRTALRRFAQKSQKPAPAPMAMTNAHATASENLKVAGATNEGAAADVVLSPKLTEKLEETCAYCHDGEDLQDFSSNRYSRNIVLGMLERVAFGDMPKTPEGIDDLERREFIHEFAAALWQNKTERASAVAFFSDGMRAHPVHAYRASLRAVSKEAEAKKHTYYRAVEPAVLKSLQRYSPGFGAATGFAALKACKSQHDDSEELRRCIQRSTDPQNMIVGRVGAAEPVRTTVE